MSELGVILPMAARVAKQVRCAEGLSVKNLLADKRNQRRRIARWNAMNRCPFRLQFERTPASTRQGPTIRWTAPGTDGSVRPNGSAQHNRPPDVIATVSNRVKGGAGLFCGVAIELSANSGRLLRHRPERSERRLNYEQVYQPSDA